MVDLPNIAQETFGNFTKVIAPIIIILLILAVIKWIQSISKKTSSNITVIRPPSR